MIFGNGLALSNLQAGALSVHPESAGTASGLSGFLQMRVSEVKPAISKPVDVLLSVINHLLYPLENSQENSFLN